MSLSRPKSRNWEKKPWIAGRARGSSSSRRASASSPASVSRSPRSAASSSGASGVVFHSKNDSRLAIS
jgi:hypothetical protein